MFVPYSLWLALCPLYLQDTFFAMKMSIQNLEITFSVGCCNSGWSLEVRVSADMMPVRLCKPAVHFITVSRGSKRKYKKNFSKFIFDYWSLTSWMKLGKIIYLITEISWLFCYYLDPSEDVVSEPIWTPWLGASDALSYVDFWTWASRTKCSTEGTFDSWIHDCSVLSTLKRNRK